MHRWAECTQSNILAHPVKLAHVSTSRTWDCTVSPVPLPSRWLMVVRYNKVPLRWQVTMVRANLSHTNNLDWSWPRCTLGTIDIDRPYDHILDSSLLSLSTTRNHKHVTVCTSDRPAYNSVRQEYWFMSRLVSLCTEIMIVIENFLRNKTTGHKVSMANWD